MVYSGFRFQRFGAGAAAIERTNPSRGRWVVLSEQWALYPGWNVRTATGRALSIERADGISSAVFLPAGEASFSAHYAPRSVQLGLACYVLGLLAALLIALWPERAQIR